MIFYNADLFCNQQIWDFVDINAWASSYKYVGVLSSCKTNLISNKPNLSQQVQHV